MIAAFSIAPTPQLYFGEGKSAMLGSIAKGFGKQILLVRGKQSFDVSAEGKQILSQLSSEGFDVRQYSIGAEPTPSMINEAVSLYSSSGISVVVGIGGGSVLDAAKAISAMLPIGGDVKDYLEGVGTRNHPGNKVPFIAVPTTSGTGSEATKNAVISEVGVDGFKRSLRHNNFVPDVAIVDPLLTLSCPASVTAASGMDAFTQLLESYVSVNANAVTDSLAYEGLQCVAASLLPVYRSTQSLALRSAMSLAAYLSGITLANAGLGLVHGFASSIGGRYDIPHGVICSSVMPAANQVTVRKLRKNGNSIFLLKYARAGALFTSKAGASSSYYVDALLEFIGQCHTELQIPTLSQAGVDPMALPRLAATTDNKYNPVKLEREEILEVLTLSL
jgi:alcohol dehydrogenase class IV